MLVNEITDILSRKGSKRDSKYRMRIREWTEIQSRKGTQIYFK